MEKLGISNLTSEQIEEFCTVAEETARKHVLSKISPKKIETLNVTVETEGSKPVTLTIDIDLVLVPSMKDFDAQKLAEEAVKEAFSSAEEYLRKLTCRSQK